MTYSHLEQTAIVSEYENDFSDQCNRLMTDLTMAMTSGNPEAVHKVAEASKGLYNLQFTVNGDYEVLKLYFGYSIGSFIDIAKKNGLPRDIAETYRKSYYKSIAKSNDRNALIKLNFFIVEDLMKAMKKYGFKNYSQVIRMALEYIHNNKFKTLSTKEVASVLNTNSSYLSSHFHEEVGMTLTDYIHRLKMDYALELIHTNGYKLTEISELLSYSSYPYFSKVFKQIHHVTPAEYIKNKDWNDTPVVL